MENLTCPKCGFVHEDWWEYLDPVDDDADFDMRCQNCDTEFYVEVRVSRTFNTYLKE